MENLKETDRIIEAYRRRSEKDCARLYSYFSPAALLIIHQRERALLGSLGKEGLTTLSDKTILDVGCGTGAGLREMVRYGAVPEDLHGIDLLEDRIALAREISPNMNFRTGDASLLPYEDARFDIVMQFTAFTSILDAGMKQAVAKEMLRVLRPQGLILWYDYHMDNPQNADVRGVGKKEINELFRGCDIRLKRVTLAPPLTRAIAPHSIISCQLLEKVPFLCTHYLGMIRKRLRDD